MAFEYSLVEQSLHNISLAPWKNNNNDTRRILKISLGFNVIKFCFVDLGSLIRLVVHGFLAFCD